MNKKEKIEVIESTCAFVVWTAICFVVISFFGSCTTSQKVEAKGRTVIVTTDTTVVNHGGHIKFQK
nr:MAG: hypothetical protein [Bacteriophage sp.]